jgi:hypothetical protein
VWHAATAKTREDMTIFTINLKDEYLYNHHDNVHLELQSPLPENLTPSRLLRRQ